MDAMDAVDVEHSDIPTNVGAMDAVDAGAQRRPRADDSCVEAMDAIISAPQSRASLSTSNYAN